MIWFWLGFFAFVAVLLALDLGVLHRKAKTPTIRSAAYWTAGWMALGLSFTGFVYLMYEHAWLGAKLVEPSKHPGTDASIMLHFVPTNFAIPGGAPSLEYLISGAKM